MSLEIGIISLCLECKNFSEKSKPMAKKNNGDNAVWEGRANWCMKHDTDLVLIEHNKAGMIPDVADCESFEKK